MLFDMIFTGLLYLCLLHINNEIIMQRTQRKLFILHNTYFPQLYLPYNLVGTQIRVGYVQVCSPFAIDQGRVCSSMQSICSLHGIFFILFYDSKPFNLFNHQSHQSYCGVVQTFCLHDFFYTTITTIVHAKKMEPMLIRGGFQHAT